MSSLRAPIVVAVASSLFACRSGDDDRPEPPAAAAASPGATSQEDGGAPARTSSAPPAVEAGAPEPPPPPPKVTVTTETVQALGVARTYVLAAPVSYDAVKSYPLVIAFHGDGGSGAGMRAVFPLDDISGDAAFVAYPDSKGGASWDLYTPEATNEDDAFVFALVADLTSRFAIDPTRVFGAGYSSGAFFIEQLACRRASLFRAIAPSSGGAPNEPQDPAASFWKPYYTKCANQTSGVPALVVHGTDDTVVEPESGDFSAQYWAYVGGCDEAKETRTPATPPPCVEHAACPPGMRVVYCPIAGIGHGLWSEASKAAWSFFAAY